MIPIRRYQYVCSASDTSCGASQIGETFTKFTCASQQLCDAFGVAGSPYRNGMCCNWPHCNEQNVIHCVVFSPNDPSSRIILNCPDFQKCSRYTYQCPSKDDKSCNAAIEGMTLYQCVDKEFCTQFTNSSSPYKNGMVINHTEYLLNCFVVSPFAR